MSDTATGTEGTDEPQGTEGTDEQTTEETPTIESLQAAIEDLKKESRKWEGRAKDNFSAKQELDKIRREQMTDAERAEADKAEHAERITTAEKERDEAVAALARYKVATEFGLSAEDAEALAEIKDENTLRALAERLAGRSPGVKPNPAQGRAKKPAASTPGEAFAEALGDLFN